MNSIVNLTKLLKDAHDNIEYEGLQNIGKFHRTERYYAFQYNDFVFHYCASPLFISTGMGCGSVFAGRPRFIGHSVVVFDIYALLNKKAQYSDSRWLADSTSDYVRCFTIYDWVVMPGPWWDSLNQNLIDFENKVNEQYNLKIEAERSEKRAKEMQRLNAASKWNNQ